MSEIEVLRVPELTIIKRENGDLWLRDHNLEDIEQIVGHVDAAYIPALLAALLEDWGAEWMLQDAQGWFYRGFLQKGLSLWEFDVSVANSAVATRFESVHEAYKAAQCHGGCLWYAVPIPKDGEA